jgi:hypothetical protein
VSPVTAGESPSTEVLRRMRRTSRRSRSRKVSRRSEGREEILRVMRLIGLSEAIDLIGRRRVESLLGDCLFSEDFQPVLQE